MNIEFREIPVRELVAGYQDNDEAGVIGYSNRLDIRPAYQREFIYKDSQRDAVVETISKSFPLNVMYWAVRDDGNFEVIDGQQRTISICQFVEGDFSFKNRYFHNLEADEQDAILDYRLTVYLCSGKDSEKLDWFRTINIAGEKLTDQELRNAVYSGPWVSDAKRYFSKTSCAAFMLAGDYMTGSPIRQEYLETVIRWINFDDVEGYMGRHQLKSNANELWLYFQAVIAWTMATFPKYRREMKGVEWGALYNGFRNGDFDSTELEKRVASLMADDEVSKKKGIYTFVLDGREKHLNIRVFTDNQKREAYEKQNGICTICGEHFTEGEMEGDHIVPWRLGGKTDPENCQMLCVDDNRTKSGK